jgi:hypothetical protein
VAERILREEAAVRPARPEPGAQVLDVGGHAGPVGAEPDRRHGGVAPEGLEVRRVRVRLHRQPDVLDVVAEADPGDGVRRRVEAQAVLHLRDHLRDLGVGELQRGRRALHDHDPDRDRALQVRARRRRRLGRRGGDRRARLGRERHHRRAARHVPVLAGARAVLLGLAELLGLAQPQGCQPEALDLAEPIGLRRAERPRLRHSCRHLTAGDGEDAELAVAVDHPRQIPNRGAFRERDGPVPVQGDGFHDV